MSMRSSDMAQSGQAAQQASPAQRRWQELEQLLADAQRGLDRLQPERIERLVSLYRAVASDLARARSEGWPARTTNYLNDLVARAHSLIYSGRRRRRLGLIVYFLGVVPTTFRRRWRYAAAAAAIMAAAMGVGMAVAAADEQAAERLLPREFARFIEDFAKSPEEAGRYFADQPVVKMLGGLAFGGFLFVHNLQVALVCFATGPLAGVITIAELLANGHMLGVFLGIGARVGGLYKLISVVAPHGFSELAAVCIAAGGGLLMAHAVVAPGPYRRGEALRAAAVDGLAMMAAALPMLLAAGLTEGNVSPLHTGLMASDAARIAAGLGLLAACAAWLLWGERLLPARWRQRIPPPPPWPGGGPE